MGKSWFVAKSKPQKETWLQSCLKDLGVEVFYPLYSVRKRGKQIKEPLFPTYLFCYFDSEELKWPAIRWAPGLNYFLNTDGIPTRVPDEMVDYIRHRVDLWNNGGNSPKHLRVGDKVKISNGPFSGFEGIFQKYISSRKRCQILLNVVGRMSRVEINEGDLAMAMMNL